MIIRAVFYEEDDARAVAAHLLGDGFEATVSRDRLAGEDDDEDHPWAVLTDAPEFLVDLLVEQHDGWVEVEGAPGGAGNAAPTSVVPPPPPLPDAPRRIKGHFSEG